ncbi:arrestin domain-containing protein 3-like [Synchiropus splendidus]|uniref:arrestin domain-containing protein 3-like n=1 Tax=Synchiropus splendidus TaxID=270530 RepID=UPI00237EE3E6|nr:arrestin domain-containing protein 3-like [Synchiropus splendidus]
MFEQTFKNFTINFNSVSERFTVSSGDIVTGQLGFDLTKDTSINSITIKIVGQVNVHWSSGSSKNRRHYSAKVEYFKLKSNLLQNGAVSSAAAKLRPGRYAYPFTCHIPHGDFPSSFKGAFGEIKYTFKVSISRSWHLDKDFATDLDFVNRINMNQPDLWSPMSGANSKTLCCLWCASGPITMDARLEKKAFAPGEVVKIFCEFGNASSRVVTPTVKLQQKQSFFTHNRVSSRLHFRTLASETGQPLNPHGSAVHTMLMLTIPADASPTISNCSVLVVDYVIELSLRMTASSNLVVIFPIILYEPPMMTLPPPYS